MEYLPFAFAAGLLTVLSPCVLPVLPVVLSGSLKGKDKWRPLVITASLALSIVIFTLLLKSTTLFIDVPLRFWAYISGFIITMFGLVTVFPEVWEKLSTQLGLNNSSQKLLYESNQRKGLLGDALVGMSLGPVFSSCSPTYALIIATILPQSFFVGLVNLTAYALGLALIILLIALFGQKLISKLRWAADPHGLFRKILGLIMIIVGLAIFFGLDKRVETYLIEKGWLGTTYIDQRLLEDKID